MIADILSNYGLNPIVTELFIRFIKLNISLVFIANSYFAVPKHIMRRDLQQAAIDDLLDIFFKDLWNL